MRILSKLAPALVVSAGLCFLAGKVHALEADQTWSQEEVTAAATEFEQSVDALFRATRASQFDELTKRNSVYLMAEDLKRLRRFTSRLARQLREGQGQEDTAVLFDRVELLVRDLRAKRGRTPILQNAQAEIEKARAELDTLSRFYRTGGLPPVATPPSSK